MKQSKPSGVSPETGDRPNRYLDALRLIRNITVAANASATVEQAVLAALDQLLQFTQWYGGAVFMPAECGSFRLLHLRSLAGRPEENAAAMRKEFADKRWRPGADSLVGRVAQSAEPEWATESQMLREPQRYLYGSISLRHGIKTGLGFPVVADGSVAAILVFGDTTLISSDTLLCELMKEIGVQLGHVVRRDQARRALQAKQIALAEVLQIIQSDQDVVGRRVVANVEKLVLPHLRLLKESLRGEQIKSIREIESALREIVSPFADNLSRRIDALTPAEIRICRHIRNGLSVKEIARLEELSCDTVSTHRRSIRRKMGLVEKKTNLAAHLSAIADNSTAALLKV